MDEVWDVAKAVGALLLIFAVSWVVLLAVVAGMTWLVYQVLLMLT